MKTGIELQDRPDFYLDEAWLVRPSRYQIVSEDIEVQVGPTVMHVLVCLAEQAGEVVTRDVLMATVWPESYVVEESLTRCISDLRKVFQDDPKQSHVIETVRSAGYRLMLPVRFANGQVSMPVLEPMPPALKTRPSVWMMGAGLLILLVGAMGWFSATRFVHHTAVVPMEVVPVTSYPGVEQDAALSPDGELIAFVWDGNTEGDYDLYLKTVGTATRRQLTTGTAIDRSPVWSPDGHHVAFQRYQQEDSCGLFVVSVLDGAERHLGDCDPTASPGLSWSPDGAWLAFSAEAETGGPHRIVLHALETGERRPLTQPTKTTYGDKNPVFSPDGSRLAFIRTAFESSHDLYVVTLATGQERRITFDQRNIHGHAWYADGSQMVFASDRGGVTTLWRVSAQGGAVQWMAIPGDNAYFPTIAQQGHRLAFTQNQHEINLWRYTRQGLPSVGHEPVAASTYLDFMPHFSPDGRRMAFASNRSGAFELWSASADGTALVQHTTGTGSFVGAPRWSPDGRKLAFNAHPDGHADLFVLDLEARTTQRLTTSVADDWLPTWSHDGQWFYFGSDRDGTWRIWKMPAVGGEAVPVTAHGALAQESPDGQFLYFAGPDRPGIWRRALVGGDETLVVMPSMPQHAWASWVVASEGLYFFQHDGDEPVIAFYRFETQAVEVVTQIVLAPRQHVLTNLPNLAVSPDGTQLVYAKMDRNESDILLVEMPQ